MIKGIANGLRFWLDFEMWTMVGMIIGILIPIVTLGVIIDILVRHVL